MPTKPCSRSEPLDRMHTWFLSYELHLLAMALTVLPAMFELGVNEPLPRAMYLAYAAFSGALLWLCNGRRWTKRTTNAGLLFMSLLACLHFVPWSPRKVFLTKFQSIEPGTTLRAVHSLLEPYVFRENRSTRAISSAPTGTAPCTANNPPWRRSPSTAAASSRTASRVRT